MKVFITPLVFAAWKVDIIQGLELIGQLFNAIYYFMCTPKNQNQQSGP